MTVLPVYAGPQCPRCNAALEPFFVRTGTTECPVCGRMFEATAFVPAVREAAPTPQVTEVGPEGANACATHARNAATASCQRCGLFICALCDMNIGNGSYCPSCFDRVRTEGTLPAAGRRYRDYASVARLAALAGVLLSCMFLGVPAGALAVYYGVKARGQRRSEGRSTVGVTLIMILGLLEILAGLGWIGALIYGIANGPS